MGTMRADAIRRLVALMEDLGLDTIFDIGSGYGIVVYVLLLLGFEADGVEICSRWASGAVAVPQRLPAALRHLIEVPPGMREAGDFVATLLTPADRPRLGQQFRRHEGQVLRKLNEYYQSHLLQYIFQG